MPPDSVAAWLTWQEGLNPRLIDLGLDRVRPVASRMGIDSPDVPVVTVAGTNGKGSVVAFLESLALCHGLRPGCYASPWLLSYNESVRVAGRPASDEALLDAFRAVEAVRGDVALTAFEFRTLAAVHLLRGAGADVHLLEVGLGGRLDAVNLFDAGVSVITSIGLDHAEWLGRELAQIAEEKAGVARPGRPLVCGDADCGRWVSGTRAARAARLVLRDRDYRVRRTGAAWEFEGLGLRLAGLPLPVLAGEHQVDNAATALAAFALSGVAPVEHGAVVRALGRVRLVGRLQHLDDAGLRVVDVAHNAPAAGVLARWLHGHADPRTVFAVCGMFRDKDVAATLGALAGEVDTWYLASLSGPRGASALALEAALPATVGPQRRRIFTSVEAAWAAASRDAGARARVLAFGSFQTAGRVLRQAAAGPVG